METTVKNLELSWQNKLGEPLLEQAAEMADGLPFEKQREHRLNLDRADIVRSIIGEPYSDRRILTAQFGDELVGLVGVTTIGETPESPTVCLLEYELVQRNRDDIRGRLLDTIGDAYPDTTLHQQVPAQNRTARQYLRRHETVNVESTDTILQLYWPIDDHVPEPTDPSGDTDLDGGVTTPTGTMIANNPAARDAFEVTTHGPIHSRPLRTDGDVQTRQLIAVEPDESNPTLEQLLTTVHNWATDQSIDHLEWPVTESLLDTNPSLSEPMEIINKRVHYQFQLI